MRRIVYLLSGLLLFSGCTKENDAAGGPSTNPGSSGSIVYPVIVSDGFPAPEEKGDIIPDFSRVGYRWGDESIPSASLRVVKYLDAPGAGTDARVTIQAAIDEVAAMPLYDGKHRGVIIFRKGLYEVDGQINISASGIVLRGEGNTAEGTVIRHIKKTQQSFIRFHGSGSLTPARPSDTNLKDEYVPLGQFWVRVTNPGAFKVRDDVVLYRPTSEKWLKDIGMDNITPTVTADGPTVQWTDPSAINDYHTRMERVITAIRGDTLHFDNPCIMAIDSKYYDLGKGAVYKYSYTNRISECGIENMLLQSSYASEEDEAHGWSAVSFSVAEHCWMTDVHSEYFGYGIVTIGASAKNITVKNCEGRLAKSQITGSRRYTYNLGGSLCLITDCKALDGRHDYVTPARGAGPNVFHNCTAGDATGRVHSDTGPHHRWNQGTLYDNIVTKGSMNVQDRGQSGTGHGWAGANQVFWNCEVGGSCRVYSPQASAKNYCIGLIGTKSTGYMAGVTGGRPDGVWISHGTHVAPQSLYEAQLALRKTAFPGGIFNVPSAP